MALHCARRRLGGGDARGRCRCLHVHVHYHHHLPRRRAFTFSPLRWLPRLSLGSCSSWVLIPLVLFFAVLAFAVSFLCFTLLYFVALLLSKDSDLEPIHREDGEQEGNSEAKGKTAAEQEVTGDSAMAEVSAMRLEIKEVRVDGFSQVSRMASSSDAACIDCEVPPRTNGDELVDDVNVLDTSKVDSEGFSGWHEVPVDWFADEQSIRVASSSTPGDKLPSLCSTDSAEILDLPEDMDEATGMSPDFLVESKQNMVVAPSSTSSHHDISDEYCDDGKELSACTADGIIDFIDKHETRDPAQAPDGSSEEDEKIGLFPSSDGMVPDEDNNGSTQEKDAKSALELIVESVATLKDVREKQELQKDPEVFITEANAEQSDGASNEVQDCSSERETSMLSLHSVCEEDTTSSDASSSQRYLGYEDGKQEEVTKNTTTGEESDPASAVCNIFENHQTSTEAFDGFENDEKAKQVASEETLEDEPDKIDDNSASESELNLKALPVLRRSPSQWWKLCGVVDVFAGSED